MNETQVALTISYHAPTATFFAEITGDVEQISGYGKTPEDAIRHLLALTPIFWRSAAREIQCDYNPWNGEKCS